MTTEFAGRWVQRPGGVRVPVVEDDQPKVLCKVCGSPNPAALCRPCKDSTRERVHGTHSGFNQHKRRNENPCWKCSEAESVYQAKRYRRGSLSKTDRAWAELDAVKHSWEQATRTNRRGSVAHI